MMQKLTVCAIIVSLSYQLGFSAHVARAEQSLFRQEIVGPVDSMAAPTVALVEWVDSRPIISGTYDIENTQQLRVQFFGVWHVLGISDQLVVSGDTWTLDLSSLVVGFEPGTYTIRAEATSVLGTIKTTTFTTELTGPVADPGVPGPLPADPQGPSDDLAQTGHNYIQISAGAGVMILTASVAFTVRYLLKKSEGKKCSDR